MDAAEHRTIAVAQFNETWRMLDTEDLDDEERLDVLEAALTSRHHWRHAEHTEANLATADWLVSRVLARLDTPGLATEFAAAALDRAESNDLGPFLVGCGHEALARAALAGSDDEAVAEHLAAADEALAQVTDEEEREVLAADLEELRDR